jgi:SAM-dependent methyltransferase
MSRLRRLIPRRVIVDRELRLGEPHAAVAYEHSFAKEDLARRFILDREPSGKAPMRFLDLGAGEGTLDYLLAIDRNLSRLPEETVQGHRRRFDELYEYVGLELDPMTDGFLAADICSEQFAAEHPELQESFDVVYSNNVFEHLRQPWIAARNAVWLLRPGGLCITIAPFSLRYHESPEDYFRFTHTGLASLFEDTGSVRTLAAGYDINGRRNDWQGSGAAADVCPEDSFGAWRENWFVLNVVEKLV